MNVAAAFQQIQQTEQRLLTELARHTSAIHEAMRTEIKASFEPLDHAGEVIAIRRPQTWAIGAARSHGRP